jgi:alpha-L-rhamnosidase
LLTKHYEHLKKYVDLLAAQTQEDVIPFDSLGDWLPWKTETSSKLTSTVMLILDAQIVSKAAALKGDSSDSAKYAQLAEKVKAGYIKKFLSDDYSTMTQTALALSLYFDLVPQAKRAEMFRALVANVEKQGHIDTGIIGAKYLLRILSQEGRTDLAYKIVSRKEQPGWGWWMEQGATTLWEDWKGESSLNHIMFGDVSNWFFQWIAGIGLDPQAKAFKHIIIRPQPVGDLTWAKASYQSPYGRISSSWKKDAKGFHLDVEIPANTSATVWLPGSKDSQKIGSGKYHFDVL